VCHGDQVATRTIVVQHKTQRPVQFEITPAARDAVQGCLRAVQLLLGHSKPESTVRCLGIEVDDALEISEQTEI